MTRTELQAGLRQLGLPATGSSETLKRLLDVAQCHPRTWSVTDFQLIAPCLSVHQDLRRDPQVSAYERMAAIRREGLRTGMVDSLEAIAFGRSRSQWSWSGRLHGVPTYAFVSGALRFAAEGNPRLAPGNVPLFAFLPLEAQDPYDAIVQSARWSYDREPVVADAAFLGYLAPDGTFECFDEEQARAVDYHHSFLVRNKDAYSHEGGLRFVRYGGQPIVSISGSPAMDPFEARSTTMVAKLARILIAVGADPLMPVSVDHMEFPRAQAPYQGKEIGTLITWAHRDAEHIERVQTDLGFMRPRG